MRNLIAILFVAALSSVTAQNIDLECIFSFSYQPFPETQYYGCLIRGVTVTDRSANITFSGQHLDNLTNADVEWVTITDSNTPFIIPQVFEAFPTMSKHAYLSCGLESIELPQSDTLEEINFFGNNITRIQSRLLANVPNLFYLGLRNNNISVIEENAFESDALTILNLDFNNLQRIQNGMLSGTPNLDIVDLKFNFIEEIGENAFQGLSNLKDLRLTGNRIRELAPLTFHPLTNAIYMYLSQNLLTRIEENTFATNTELKFVTLAFNRINQISPSFSRELQLGGNVITVGLDGNQCIDRIFTASPDKLNFISLNRGLRACFLNFVGEDEVSDGAAMEFTGSLRIRDRFGNILARVEQGN